MIPPAVVAAFFAGALASIVGILIAEHRAAAETAFWDDLRTDAVEGYVRVFDWQEEGL